MNERNIFFEFYLNCMKTVYIDDIGTTENIPYLDAVMDITREVFSEGDRSVGIKCAYNLVSEVHTKNASSAFLVLEGNQVIGFILYSTLIDFTAYIHWLAVKKDFRSKGVGTLLLSEMEKRIKNEGISNILLISQDFSFYERYGYEKVKETYRDKIVGDIGRSEWLMIKNIYK